MDREDRERESEESADTQFHERRAEEEAEREKLAADVQREPLREDDANEE